MIGSLYKNVEILLHFVVEIFIMYIQLKRKKQGSPIKDRNSNVFQLILYIDKCAFGWESLGGNDMNQFIIATHSTLAEGFAQAIHFFYSDLENLRFLNAYVESQELEKELRAVLEEVRGENIVLLTDIPGGSVNQVAMKLQKEYGFQLAAGINLPMLLDLVSESRDVGPETIRSALETGREGMVYMNDLTPTEEVEEDTEEL